MKFILGRKLDMTQVWQSDDKVVAVTRVKIDPCVISQVKTNEKDGYTAVQVGSGEKKEKNIKKPQKGHLKNLGNLRDLREFRIEETGDLKIGDKIDLSTFEIGDKVQVTSISKGKGFQGVVKRHGFKGQQKTHGNKDQLRMPGSIGATGPAHVFKGMRMPGRMGGDQVTTKNLKVIEVDLENNIISISGSVPGARNGLVLISGNGELKLKVESEKLEDKKEEAPKTEEIKSEKEEKDQNSNIKEQNDKEKSQNTEEVKNGVVDKANNEVKNESEAKEDKKEDNK